MTEVRARVILQEKGLYTIKYEDRENKAEVSGKYIYGANSASDYPAVGDYVIATWPEDGSNSIISGIFPRKSVFIRKAAGAGYKEQVVAANIDTLFLCMSLNQDFNLRRLERYLAISWDSGAQPVIVLTKADLCGNVQEKISEVKAVAAGADIVAVSSQNEDFESVLPYLSSGKTVAFLGSSGVGKSTLINRLLGADRIRTSEIRQDDDKGRHTTTHRELIELANGAFVIDTPGMRELGLWNNEEGTAEVFADIEELMRACRFSNCTHRDEPGCAVCKAIKEGRLLPERWSAYRKLKSENLFVANEGEYMKMKRAKFKEIAKINKKRKSEF